MPKNLKKRKTNRQSIPRINPVAQSIVDSNPSEKIIIPSRSILNKTTLEIAEAQRYKNIKGDLKRSLILGVAIFALMFIIYFVLR
jgi:hypothetical protein